MRNRPKIDLHQAVQDAKAERARPQPTLAQRKEQQRKELERLIKTYAWETALLEMQEPNIKIRRRLESLNSTIFSQKRSVNVEISREMVQQEHRHTWEMIQAAIELLAGTPGDEGDG